jgi:hypothetical protein
LRQGKKGVYAEGLNLVSVENAADVENLVKRGNKNRSVGSHNFNEHSSQTQILNLTLLHKHLFFLDAN